MRAVMGGLALAALATATATAAAAETFLASLRWASRVLVISAPASGDPALRAQRDALGPHRGGLAERDLVVLEAVGDSAEARHLRAELGLPTGVFQAVLVGKDGGAKLTSDTPIPPQKLFATIDAMPMRRDEMHGRR